MGTKWRRWCAWWALKTEFLDFWVLAIFLLVCLAIFGWYIESLGAEGPKDRAAKDTAIKDIAAKDPALSELENTKLRLVQEKIKSQSLSAALLQQEFSQNQAEGQRLKGEESDLIRAICTAHGFKPDECVVSKDGKRVTPRPDPTGAVVDAKKP